MKRHKFVLIYLLENSEIININKCFEVFFIDVSQLMNVNKPHCKVLPLIWYKRVCQLIKYQILKNEEQHKQFRSQESKHL